MKVKAFVNVELDVDDEYYKELQDRYSKGDLFLTEEEAKLFSQCGNVVNGGMFTL